jgi:hypothetical protein
MRFKTIKYESNCCQLSVNATVTGLYDQTGMKGIIAYYFGSQIKMTRFFHRFRL